MKELNGNGFTDPAWVAGFEAVCHARLERLSSIMARSRSAGVDPMRLLNEGFDAIAKVSVENKGGKTPAAAQMFAMADLAMAGLMLLRQKMAGPEKATPSVPGTLNDVGSLGFDAGRALEAAADAGYAALLMPRFGKTPMFAASMRPGMTAEQLGNWLAALVFGAESAAATMVRRSGEVLGVDPAKVQAAMVASLLGLRMRKHQEFVATNFADISQLERKVEASRPKLPRRCMWKQCGKPATHVLRFLLRHATGAPAPSELCLCVCPDCGSTITLDDVMGEETWQAILQGFAAAGKAAPERSLTELRVVPFAEASDEILGQFEAAGEAGGAEGGAS